jgi:xanthine dehydrogenase YagS FAD-binding subunit
VTLNGIIVVRSAGKEPERIAAADFFVLPSVSLMRENVLKPGQMITEVILPKAPVQSATVEIREKQSFDWPVAMACVARIEGRWRVCLGAVAPIPWLSKPAMKILADMDITPDLAAAAGEAAVEEAEPMTDNQFRVQLVKVAVRRAILTAAGLEVPSWT